MIGEIGVIFSLLYLTLQISTQNKKTKLAAAHGIFGDLRDASHNLGSVSEIFVRAIWTA